MSIVDVTKRSAEWRNLLEKHATKALIRSLEEAPVIEVADFLSEQSLEKCVMLFPELSLGTQASVFAHFSIDIQRNVYAALAASVFAQIFEAMPSDVRADFYGELDESQQVKLLPFLSKKVRTDVITLSTYSPDKAGGIMNTDFVAVPDDATVGVALHKIREESPAKKMIYFVYIVNKAKKLVGIVDLKDLVLAKPEEPVISLANETVIFANLQEDQERVAQKIEKYDLLVLPILNDEEQLVGIVNYDDALEVIRKEEKEDMEKFMGIVPDEHYDTYMRLSSMQHFKKRVGWVIGLFLLGVLTTTLMHYYEAVITMWGFLGLYILTISDTGGNVGSQSATMVIRALSSREIAVKQWLGILWKEIKVAIMMALCLFVFCFAKVWLFSSYHETNPNAGHIAPDLAAFIIALTIALQVIASIAIGTLLPLLMKKLGQDPALAASPAITTIVDIVGLFIYFVVASSLLNVMT